MHDDSVPSAERRPAIAPLVPLVLLGLSAAGLVASWSTYPGDYDPINFVTALTHYEIAVDSPHPPGYPLFVGLGRVAAAVVGPFRAYQLVNTILALLAATLLYALGRRLGSPLAGLLAAAVLVTHPLVLAVASAPESYLSDAFFATLFASLPLLSRKPTGRGLVLAVGAAFTACALFRPVSVAMLAPLGAVSVFVACVAFGAPRAAALRQTAQSAGLGLAGAAGAYLFTVWLGGGREVYGAATARVMGAAFRASSVLGGAPPAAHASMAVKCLGWFAAFALPLLIVAAFLAVRRPGALRRAAPGVVLAVGAAWLLPPLGFYLAIYYLKPFYHLITLPALTLALAWLLAEALFPGRPRASVAVAGALVALQLAFFWLPWKVLPAQLYRLTHAWSAKREAAWNGVSASLAGVRWDSDLVVFDAHPDLHPLSVKLLADGRPFALASPGGDVRYFGRFWLEVPEADRHVVPDRYDRLWVIDSSAPGGAVRTIDLRAAGTRDLARLLGRGN